MLQVKNFMIKISYIQLKKSVDYVVYVNIVIKLNVIMKLQ